MPQNLIDLEKLNIKYEVGNIKTLMGIDDVPARAPFDERVIEFLNVLSKTLLGNRSAKLYPDVVTFAFWIRKSSMMHLKERYYDKQDSIIQQGRGVVFHIAPSNVPVNYAYSLVTGLVCGNKNIVRIPSKDFEQVNIINGAINNVLKEYSDLSSYICLIKYGHDKDINDYLSKISDVRVIWGGDNTIAEVRKSPLKPRATEVTFADRFSLAVIDADEYIKLEEKNRIANDFYNDTYLSDQNACTSPRVVVWIGKEIEKAKEVFWNELYNIVRDKYDISGVQAINKLTSGFIFACRENTVKTTMGDNLIVRMQTKELSVDLIELKDDSGYFFEYDCKNIIELKELCNDSRIQTISYIGNKELFVPLISAGVQGIDRIVPVGQTMDFDFIWDGYNLFDRLTRSISII